MTFGEVFQYYMDKVGMTQSEVARKMGTGRQTINSIVKGGRRGPTLETALGIADALGIPLDDMIFMMKNDRPRE